MPLIPCSRLAACRWFIVRTTYIRVRTYPASCLLGLVLLLVQSSNKTRFRRIQFHQHVHVFLQKVAPPKLETHRWMAPPASGVAKAEDRHTMMLPRRATARKKELMVATAIDCCLRWAGGNGNDSKKESFPLAGGDGFWLQRVLYRNNAFWSGVDVLEPKRMLASCASKLTQCSA